MSISENGIRMVLRKQYKVIVTGGRHYSNHPRVNEVLTSIAPDIIVQGGANGADRLAREWGEKRGLEVITFEAEWEVYGRRAGPVRNRKMCAAGADLLVAFPGGKGTRHCVRTARDFGIKVRGV